jgi:hypothetical protein
MTYCLQAASPADEPLNLNHRVMKDPDYKVAVDDTVWLAKEFTDLHATVDSS